MTRIPPYIIGLLLLVVSATSAQRRPPNYSQDRMPVTSFSCRDKIIGGYYADPETDCQMFHVCVKVPGQGVQDYKFLCPNETAFDQENQICDDWFNIDCEASTLYYSDNFDLYRIGSDFPRSNQGLPSNNINNAVSENDDDLYLQRNDRGENVGSDLLRGSHSSNFYSNKNRGREDEEDDKEDYKKKTTNKNGVRKLLTGRRPIATTEAPVENYPSSTQYIPRNNNNNYAGRVSNFRGHVRNQQPSTESPTTQPTRPTEAYNRQAYNQRNFYSPTTPKVETTPAPQKTDFYRNYNNPTTKRNYYENTQNYNYQTTAFAQTTRNYQTPRVVTTTVQPTTAYVDTSSGSEVNNFYETQKLYKLNTGGAFNQYDDAKDEFLKTAPSQNLGASAFNSLQNSYKNFNTSVSGNYNFNPTVKPTTNNYQTQTYFNPSTQTPNYYTQTTQKPFQQQNYYTTPKAQPSPQNYYTTPNVQPSPQNYYTTPKAQPSQQAYQQNYYNPSTQTGVSTPKVVAQYSPTTLRSYSPQAFTQTTATPFVQYNPTTIKPFQQQYNQQTKKPYQQQNYQTQNTPNSQQTTNFQAQRNTAAPQNYPQVQKNQTPQLQRNPSHYQQTSNYYNPTTAAPKAQGFTDATERPRPFTPDVKKEEKKEKEQYDYAYYDDGTQSEYDSLEPLEEFKRTKSKN